MNQTSKSYWNKKQVKNFAKRHAGVWAFKLFRTYVIICLSFVVLYPILYMISVSFKNPIDLADQTVIWIPKHFTWNVMKETISIMKYWKSLGTTAFLSFVPTVCQLLTCSLAAYGMSRFNFKGVKVLSCMVLFGILVPLQTITIPMFMQIRYFDFFGVGRLIGLFTGMPLTVNLFNTPMAIILPAVFGCGLRGCLYIFIFRQFFKGMPMDLEDAAYIDGCGVLKTFFKIIIPLSLPSFLVSFILSVIWYWNDAFLVPFFYSKGQTLAMQVDTLVQKLSLTHDYTQIFSYQQAACLLMILPVLLMFLILQKYFIQSIDRTGLK